jgi:hypothetical protein
VYLNKIKKAMTLQINHDLVENKHVKPQNLEQFGYFLAGLIDADGHISKRGYLEICFHSRDLRIACYIKKILGGNIYKYKKVNACRYYCTSKQNLLFLSQLILNKLCLPSKVIQFNTRLRPRASLSAISMPMKVNDRTFWFAGFVQGDGSFQIKLRKQQTTNAYCQVEIMLMVELKTFDLLKQIQRSFGGSVGYRKSRHTYYYSSVNLSNASKLVIYFDQFQVMGLNYKIYLCWKQALNMVLKKQHLTTTGLEKIKGLKTRMTLLRNTRGFSL